MTIASTHYPRLKMWASQTPGVRNASVEFDERTLRPTYRLILGIAGASSGVEIARRMHVPEDILSTAKALVEPSHAQAREYLRQLKETLDEQESLRASLEEERAAMAEKYSRLDADFAGREESRKAEFESALARIVGDFKAESEKAMRKIKDRVEAARLKRTAENQAAELRRKSAKLRQAAGSHDASMEGSADSAETEEIVEGDRVTIQSLDRDGTVETIRDGTYTVMVGPLRYRAERGDLKRVSGHPGPTTPVLPRPEAADTSEAAISELKVIGLTADEALDRVDKFLDQAFFAGVETVRIIHGHGKGILRNAIAGFLTHHPQVERFALAPPEKGGGGATVVELRK